MAPGINAIDLEAGAQEVHLETAGTGLAAGSATSQQLYPGLVRELTAVMLRHSGQARAMGYASCGIPWQRSSWPRTCTKHMIKDTYRITYTSSDLDRAYACRGHGILSV